MTAGWRTTRQAGLGALMKGMCYPRVGRKSIPRRGRGNVLAGGFDRKTHVVSMKEAPGWKGAH